MGMSEFDGAGADTTIEDLDEKDFRRRSPRFAQGAT